jgi:hypothetical protein
MRIEQREGTKGSLKFIQQLITRKPAHLAQHLATIGVIPSGAPVMWLSPLAEDQWAEYRDEAFLQRIGHPALAADLKSFWPARGPQWDGLAKCGDVVLLVEAKAHVGELASSCAAESPVSRDLITKSLDATKRALGAKADADWMNGYYQLANRLAHLSFLRERGVDARLVLLQFTGDTGMPTESTPAAYESAYTTAMTHLGFGEAATVPGVVHVNIDVADLSSDA